jgi:hypothetical protein
MKIIFFLVFINLLISQGIKCSFGHHSAREIEQKKKEFQILKGEHDIRVFLSKNNLFKIFYTDSGDLAVRPGDENNDSIPDYVELTAQYLEDSYYELVEKSGFRNPIHKPYEIYYHNALYFGATIQSLDKNKSYIEIHKDFLDFRPNSDHISWQGALKATCAHEFKHAIQVEYSGYDELYNYGFIAESDAVWAEEFVFPFVNDHVNEASGINVFNNTQFSLIANMSDFYLGYSNPYWQIFLEKTFGVQFLVDLWNNINQHNLKKYYDVTTKLLEAYNSNFGDIYLIFQLWAYFVNDYADVNYGFEEDAPFLPHPPRLDTLRVGELESEKSLPMFSGDRFFVTNYKNKSGFLKFSGRREDNFLNFGVGGKTVFGDHFFFPISENSEKFDFTLPIRNEEITHLVFLSSNSDLNRNSLQKRFTVKVEKIEENKAQKTYLLKTNPIFDEIRLMNFASQDVVSKYYIYNVLGQVVKKGTISESELEVKIDFENYAGGLYFLKILSNREDQVFKFVKLK